MDCGAGSSKVTLSAKPGELPVPTWGRAWTGKAGFSSFLNPNYAIKNQSVTRCSELNEKVHDIRSGLACREWGVQSLSFSNSKRRSPIRSQSCLQRKHQRMRRLCADASRRSCGWATLQPVWNTTWTC
jgi:hypothetical protein